MMRIARVAGWIVLRLFPWPMFSFVLNDACALSDGGDRKNSPAVDTGFFDHDSPCGFTRAVTIGASFHRLLNLKRIPARDRVYRRGLSRTIETAFPPPEMPERMEPFAARSR